MNAEVASNYSVEVGSLGDLLAYPAQVSEMVKNYLADSKDNTATEDDMLQMLKDRVAHDEKFILVFLRANGIPIGFMCADIRGGDDKGNGKVAFILAAYLPPKVASEAAISEALTMFDNWGRAQGAKQAQFYTFRHPKAHQFMIKRNWKHTLTIYTKEL